MFGERAGFEEDLTYILGSVIADHSTYARKQPETAQIVLAGATTLAPENMVQPSGYGLADSAGPLKWLHKVLDSNTFKERVEVVRGPRSGMLPKGMSVQFHQASKAHDKHPLLFNVLDQIDFHKAHTKTVVFCNTVQSCRSTAWTLEERYGEDKVDSLSGAIPANQRAQVWKRFADPASETKVLVCTDLSARGLDTEISDVVMFDVPRNIEDFIHRAGRTARAEAKGIVHVLHSNNPHEVDMKKKILAALKGDGNLLKSFYHDEDALTSEERRRKREEDNLRVDTKWKGKSLEGESKHKGKRAEYWERNKGRLQKAYTRQTPKANARDFPTWKKL